VEHHILEKAVNNKSFLAKFGSDSPVLDLKITSRQIKDEPMPESLVWGTHGFSSGTFSRSVKVNQHIEKGLYLAQSEGKSFQPSPVQGVITNIKHIPNLRGGDPLSAVFLEPDKDQTESKPAFPPLSWQEESVETLRMRLREAGVLNTIPGLKLLSEVLLEKEDRPVILTALNFEPGLASAVATIEERKSELGEALKCMAKLCGPSKIRIAATEETVHEYEALKADSSMEWLPIPAVYPQNVPMRIAQLSGLNDPVFISIETVFTSYDAIGKGCVQDRKIVSILNRRGELLALHRYYIGTKLSDATGMAGLNTKDGDSLIVGGLYSGTAQYSLDGSIDAGTDALMLIHEHELLPWSHDPCVSCGSCNDVCPANLQVSLLTRNCEFGLYENARQLDLNSCIECGLCASACSVRRPLLQMIQLGKEGLLEKAKVRELRKVPEPEVQKPGMFQDPAMALYNQPERLRVGASPFTRAKTSLTQTNYTMLLALLPVVLVSAIAFMSDQYVANQGTSFGVIPSFINETLAFLGIGPKVLTMIGVFGMAALGMGTGVLFEYMSQVLMRQRYEATNGHGALMGLLVVFLMPPAVPPLILMLGVILAVVIGKQIFGGIGSYPIHPAIVGWLIVFISWPHDIHPIGAATLGSSHMATMIALLVMGLLLGLRGVIRLRVPAGVLIGVALFTPVLQSHLDGGIVDQLFSGHVMLAAFFLATDSTCSPINKMAGWLYGLGIGFLIILIRAFGVWPDAIPFAVMLMNILNPLLDRIRPKVRKEAV
jgi:electron transport complex protein RnfD